MARRGPGELGLGGWTSAHSEAHLRFCNGSPVSKKAPHNDTGQAIPRTRKGQQNCPSRQRKGTRRNSRANECQAGLWVGQEQCLRKSGPEPQGARFMVTTGRDALS